MELRLIGLNSRNEQGPNEERRFIIMGGILDTPINNFLASHNSSSTRLSCPCLPHKGPSSPILIIVQIVIENMVSFSDP
jgi:hypothetical protein